MQAFQIIFLRWVSHVSYRQKSYTTVAILLGLIVASAPQVVSWVTPAVLAQSAQNGSPLPVPQTVPSGTVVQISGSKSMATVNDALTQRFKAQFPGTDVKIAYDGTDTALKALLEGRADVAAIGRPLTDDEKAQGLAIAPIARYKIAIIVGSSNPFKKTLTDEEVARIFRGEITDWSEVGGSAGPIRVVDRPDTSDIRQSLTRYPIFPDGVLKTGDNAVKVEDNTDAVIKALGNNGIGYALVNELINNPNVTVLPVFGVLPTDPQYAFSQPLLYVYKTDKASPGAAAFLGFATAAGNQQIITAAGGNNAAPPTAAAPLNPPATGEKGPAPSPGATNVPPPIAKPDAAIATEPGSGVPWWLWFLPLPLIGGLIWLFKDRGGAMESEEAGVAIPPSSRPRRESRLVLTPRNCRDVYAYWEVEPVVKENLWEQGGRQMKLRLYDVTNINLDYDQPHNIQEFDCDDLTPDLHIPIAQDDRDYLADLGYVTNDGRWLPIARSPEVHVPACEPAPRMPATPLPGEAAPRNLGGDTGTTTPFPGDVIKGFGAVIAGGTAAAAAATAWVPAAQPVPARQTGGAPTDDYSKFNRDCRMILVPRSVKEAYVYWEVSDAYKAEARRQGGQTLTLRVHDVTNLNPDYQAPHYTQEYLCSEQDFDKHVSVPIGDLQSDPYGYRDFLAELGYYTADNRWIGIVRSFPVHISANDPA